MRRSFLLGASVLIGGIVLCRIAVVSDTAQTMRTRKFFVAADAPAGGDGSAAHPWRTPREAIDGVRRAREAGAVGAGVGIEVVFASGEYRVDGGLKLTAADSGTAGADVVWRTDPADARHARFVSGVAVPPDMFSPVKDAAVIARIPEKARRNIWVADISSLIPEKLPPMSDSFDGMPTLPLLFIGRDLAPLARWPNAGFTSFTKGVDKGGASYRRANGKMGRTGGAFIYSDPRAKRWDFDSGVWMNGYWTHDWHNHSVRAARYGVENGTNDVVRLAEDIPFGVKGKTWGRSDRRFYVFNLLQELDAPGEWYLDRKRKLLYLYPLKGMPSSEDETTLVMSSQPLLKSDGLSHFRFERLDFAYTAATAIEANGDNLAFVDCKIDCVGGRGMFIRGDRVVVRGVEVCRVGKQGITVIAGDRRTLTRSETVVEGCHIHDWALFQRTYAPGISLDGCGITIRGNLLHDAPHSAIIYGGNEHLFEYNEVYRVLMETGDAGAYYTGRDWTSMGNVLRYNFTHDLGKEGGHSSTMGFYFDDCDCGDAVYGNVFWKVARGIMIGGGREHPVRNNVFAACQIGLSMDNRGMTWKQWNAADSSWMLEEKAKAFDYTNGVWAAKYPLLAKIMRDSPREPLYNPIEENVFIDCSSSLLLLEKNPQMEQVVPKLVVTNNLVYVSSPSVRSASPDGRVAAGFDVRTTCADAGFVDAGNGDFRLREGADVLRRLPAFSSIPLGRICRKQGQD